MNITRFLPDEAATIHCAKQLAGALFAPMCVYLEGDLGAGKTTFSRGLIQALGHEGAVKSPTYTIVESYQLADFRLHHFDLYRLADPEELEYLGIRDYFDDQSVTLLEWPSKGVGVINPPDITITLSYQVDGRNLQIDALTERGETWLATANI